MAIQRKVIRNIHTSFQNNEWLDELFAKEPTVQMHTKDAQARGIKQGDKVVVYNDRGQHPTVAIVNDDILPGVFYVSKTDGGWDKTDLIHLLFSPTILLRFLELEPVFVQLLSMLKRRNHEKLGFVFDARRCNGCRACVIACKEQQKNTGWSLAQTSQRNSQPNDVVKCCM